jgi:bifunctional non-homologous end joining protein LigD
MPRRANDSIKPSELRLLPAAKIGFIQPMLAKPSLHLPEGGNWLYEIKFDGYRALAVKRNSEVALYSRRGNDLNRRFRGLAEAFDFLPAKTIIDGEIVVLDKHGLPSFAALQNSIKRTQPLYFYAFDLLAYKGKDVRQLSLTARRRLLENVLRRAREPVRSSAIFQIEAAALVAAVRKQGLEGIIAKRRDSAYESGERSGAWIKYKTNKGQELVIGGYKPGSNGFDSLLAGYYDGKRLMFVGKIKNGFTPMLRRRLAGSFKGLESDVCPFANLPESKNARRGEALTADVMKTMRWLKPRLVAQVEFTEWTKGNHLRHSRFIGLRDDKDPHEVIREI